MTMSFKKKKPEKKKPAEEKKPEAK